MASWKWVLLAFVGIGGTVPAWPAGEKRADVPRPIYYGVSVCRDCHNLEKPYFNKDNPAICDCTEVKVLESQDKHLIAHKVLKGERAQRMGKLMMIADVTADRQCVSCHGVWIEDRDAVTIDESFHLDQGVSCVACHGPDAGGWVVLHGNPFIGERKKWRKLAPAEKEAKYAMTDLWDPAKRTRQCASCHVGDLAAGKVVTHDMYAAGHPPLPGFEPATFSNEMPRHWKYLKEKQPDVLALLKVDARQAELEETHLVAIGALVALQTSMDLLAAQAERAWPELAQFDCYACHHELKSDSWRQRRGYAGTPGRPPMRPWPAALADLGMFHAAGDDPKAAAPAVKALAGKMAALQAAFDRQPFGDKDAVKRAARDVSAWVQAQIEALQKQIRGGAYTRDSPARLQARLLTSTGRLAPDYDSARQIAWALTALQREASADRTGKSLRNGEAWQELNEYLKLQLPVGQTPIESSLDAGMQRIANYDPQLFARKLDALLKEASIPPRPKE